MLSVILQRIKKARLKKRRPIYLAQVSPSLGLFLPTGLDTKVWKVLSAPSASGHNGLRKMRYRRQALRTLRGRGLLSISWMNVAPHQGPGLWEMVQDRPRAAWKGAGAACTQDPAPSPRARQGRTCPCLTGASWAVDPSNSKAPLPQGQAPGSSEGHLGRGLG